MYICIPYIATQNQFGTKQGITPYIGGKTFLVYLGSQRGLFLRSLYKLNTKINK